MRTILFTTTLLVLLTSCTREGSEYLCYHERSDQELNATARLGLFSGKLEGFDATDRNGLAIKIDEDNSSSYECYSWKDLEADALEAKERQRERCERLRASDESGQNSTWDLSPCAEP